MDKDELKLLVVNNKQLLESVEEIGKNLVNIDGKLYYNINRINENISKLTASVDLRLEAVNDKISTLFENKNVMNTKILTLEEKLKTLEMKFTKERILADLYSKRNNLIICSHCNPLKL